MDLKVIIGPGCAPTLKKSLIVRISEMSGIPFEGTPWNLQTFQDGEILPQIMENIRGCDVYVVGSTNMPAENFVCLKLLLRAAVGASCGRITAVLPYMGGLRQDRKDAPRVAVTAKQNARELERAMLGAAFRHVMILHPHTPQVDLAFDIPLDLLYPTNIFISDITQTLGSSISTLVPMATDAGGGKLVETYARRFDLDFAIGDKRRNKATEEIEIRKIIGEVRGKIVVVIDDIVDTAGTLTKVAFKARELGAKEIYAYMTHALLVGKALKNLRTAVESAGLKSVVVTDSINNSERELPDWIKIVTCGELIGESIYRNHTNGSISTIDGMFSNAS